MPRFTIIILFFLVFFFIIWSGLYTYVVVFYHVQSSINVHALIPGKLALHFLYPFIGDYLWFWFFLCLSKNC